MARLVMDVDSALGVEGGDIDDAHAILLIGAHQDQFDVVAVTCVGGNVTLPMVSRSTRLVCELARIKAPVSEGANKPADRELATGHAIGAGKDEPPERWIFPREPANPPAKTNAVEAIAAAAKAGPLDILAVAPLTNIAAFLQQHPELKHNVRRIVTMGGCFDPKVTFAEFNIKTDPPAAVAVYSSGIPMIVVPLDMTRKTLLKPSDIEPWKSTNEAGRLFYEGSLNWMAKLHSRYNMNGCNLHDPLAAMYCVHPELFKIRGIVPRVDPKSGKTEILKFDDASPIKLVTEFDNAGFMRYFLAAADDMFRESPASRP